MYFLLVDERLVSAIIFTKTNYNQPTLQIFQLKLTTISTPLIFSKPDGYTYDLISQEYLGLDNLRRTIDIIAVLFPLILSFWTRNISLSLLCLSWWSHFLNKNFLTQRRILINDKNVFSLGKLHNKAGEIACAYFDMVYICSHFAELSKRYLQVSLNCLIMFATF